MAKEEVTTNGKMIILCPNCQQMATKEGNKITCEQCDAVFTITKTGSARVKEMGRLDDLDQRVKKLEAAAKGESAEPESEPGPGNEPEGDEPTDDDQEEELFER